MKACQLCGNPTKRPDRAFCSRTCKSRQQAKDKAIPVIDRLLSRVDFSGCAAGEACWNWKGSVNSSGYGAIRVKGFTGCNAQRAVYRALVGPIPDGMLVCHHCDNRLCVNPAHLFLGTYKDNAEDCFRKGRNARGKTHARTKLTDQQVLEIRRLREHGGVSLRNLGRKFGVTTQHVHSIVRGLAWRCLATEPTKGNHDDK